jgi:hypothetical protein
MTREELIDYIKRLMFKISELETTKSEVLKENKKIKVSDFEKYQQILREIKEVKEMSKVGRSMF